MSVMLPVVAISHLSGALLKLLQWTGCPLNTFHLCLHRFTEAILNIYKIRTVKKSVYYKKWLPDLTLGKEKLKVCFPLRQHHC